MKRRTFLHNMALASAGLGLASHLRPTLAARQKLFEISLAEWSLHRSLFADKIDHLDFAQIAADNEIAGLEYVNQFFMDKAQDENYLGEMNKRTDDLGVRNLLIMCDSEGRLGAPDEEERIKAVENHYKWVTAARFLGCHSIRVNGYSDGSYEEQMKLVADGLHRLCTFGDEHDIDIIVENHGGFSSNGKWLRDTIKMADHPRAGTLPDFGNFRIDAEESYDSYRGVEELMPFARGVSVKTIAYDDHGNESPLDYMRMLRIVLDSGFKGFCGIEHGEEGREIESICEVRDKLVEARAALEEEAK